MIILEYKNNTHVANYYAIKGTKETTYDTFEDAIRSCKIAGFKVVASPKYNHTEDYVFILEK